MKKYRFSEILKELRIENSVGQEKLAKSIGVTHSIISLWENGLREPTLSNLIAIADYFNVSLDFLTGREI